MVSNLIERKKREVTKGKEDEWMGKNRWKEKTRRMGKERQKNKTFKERKVNISVQNSEIEMVGLDITKIVLNNALSSSLIMSVLSFDKINLWKTPEKHSCLSYFQRPCILICNRETKNSPYEWRIFLHNHITTN